MNRRAELEKAWSGYASRNGPSDAIAPAASHGIGFRAGFNAAWDALLSEVAPLVAELHTKPFLHDDHTSRHNHSVERLRDLVREAEQ